MKTINLTLLQRVRLTIMLGQHTGSRKDTLTRMIADLQERIGLTDAEMDPLVRPLGDGRLMIASTIDTVSTQAFAVTRSEAAALLAKVNSEQLTARDLRSWADDLAEQLEEVAAG